MVRDPLPYLVLLGIAAAIAAGTGGRLRRSESSDGTQYRVLGGQRGRRGVERREPGRRRRRLAGDLRPLQQALVPRSPHDCGGLVRVRPGLQRPRGVPLPARRRAPGRRPGADERRRPDHRRPPVDPDARLVGDANRHHRPRAAVLGPRGVHVRGHDGRRRRRDGRPPAPPARLPGPERRARGRCRGAAVWERPVPRRGRHGGPDTAGVRGQRSDLLLGHRADGPGLGDAGRSPDGHRHDGRRDVRPRRGGPSDRRQPAGETPPPGGSRRRRRGPDRRRTAARRARPGAPLRRRRPGDRDRHRRDRSGPAPLRGRGVAGDPRRRPRRPTVPRPRRHRPPGAPAGPRTDRRPGGRGVRGGGGPLPRPRGDAHRRRPVDGTRRRARGGDGDRPRRRDPGQTGLREPVPERPRTRRRGRDRDRGLRVRGRARRPPRRSPPVRRRRRAGNPPRAPGRGPGARVHHRGGRHRVRPAHRRRDRGGPRVGVRVEESTAGGARVVFAGVERPRRLADGAND